MVELPIKNHVPIKPAKLIYKNQIYNITKANWKYSIYNYTIEVEETGYLSKVKITACHPNCNPRNGEFCIPDQVKNVPFNISTVIPVVNNFLQIFNLDDAYFQPWDEFTYEEGGM